MTDGEKIRTARLAAQLSIREFARRMDVHRRVVMYWEHDDPQAYVTANDARMIWLLLGVHVHVREKK